MRVEREFFICECCALMVNNGDDSGCRDYYGHPEHAASLLPFHTVVTGESAQTSSGMDCEGCGVWQGAYANMFPAAELVSSGVNG